MSLSNIDLNIWVHLQRLEYLGQRPHRLRQDPCLSAANPRTILTKKALKIKGVFGSQSSCCQSHMRACKSNQGRTRDSQTQQLRIPPCRLVWRTEELYWAENSARKKSWCGRWHSWMNQGHARKWKVQCPIYWDHCFGWGRCPSGNWLWQGHTWDTPESHGAKGKGGPAGHLLLSNIQLHLERSAVEILQGKVLQDRSHRKLRQAVTYLNHTLFCMS